MLSLGIDAEPHAPLPEGVRELVTLPAERERIGPQAEEGSGALHWDRVLFSAKESVFKTWYPVTGVELDFVEADLTMHQESDPGGGGNPGAACGTFTARLLLTDPALPTTLRGHWRIEDGVIATAVLVRPNWREEGGA